jgi:DNA-binding MarR family transcriptional regulator
MNSFAKYRLAGELDATVSGKLLYLVLLDIADADNAITIPQRRVSEAIGLTKGTVSRNLRKLRDSGYIDVIPQYHNDGGRAANKYVIKGGIHDERE